MLKLGTFKTDCTPPAGFGIKFGDNAEDHADGIRDPLWLRGFVLDDGASRCLIASLDYCALMNGAHDLLVNTLAEAAAVPPERVAVHCIHQHDAPLVDYDADAYLKFETYPRAWWQGVAAKCGQSSREALGSMREIRDVGHRETRLHGYASNRRIIGPDNKIAATRWSFCSDNAIKGKPVGVIDPMLRTIAFRDGTGKVAGVLNFYATHPQVSNYRRLYSADAPGEAMRLIEADLGTALPAYFSGPSGDITAGKYTSTDKEGNLLRFGRILADGIRLNLGAMEWEKVERFIWKQLRVPFPRRRLNRRKLMSQISDPDFSAEMRLKNAVLLSSLDNPANKTYPLSLLEFGNVRLLLLAGEPFVEYQLFAQSLVPDKFLAVAANGSDNYLYLPLRRSFAEGGYETSKFCWCTPAIEARLKKAIAALLTP